MRQWRLCAVNFLIGFGLYNLTLRAIQALFSTFFARLHGETIIPVRVAS